MIKIVIKPETAMIEGCDPYENAGERDLITNSEIRMELPIVVSFLVALNLSHQ